MDTKALLLSKFRIAMLKEQDTSMFKVRLAQELKAKQDQAKKDEIEAEKNKAVAEALAKAAADGEGGLMRYFFS